MPRLIDPGPGGPIDLEALVETIETSKVDPHDEDAFVTLGPALARLGRNPDFLARMALDALKTRCRDQSENNSYGAQVLLLRPPSLRFILRANFWPAARDPVLTESGPAAFFYGLPHDHNFPFLTYGYFGPGYWSDYFEFDLEQVAGVAGEPTGLRFVERARLEPGRLMLYRMHRDVHCQVPPDSFSVSLNILGRGAGHRWTDQYRFDTANGTIAEGLTVTASEALLAIAVATGNGVDLAQEFLARHPAERMRLTALEALAAADDAGRIALLERATASSSRRVSMRARNLLDERARQPLRLASNRNQARSSA